MQSLVQPRDRDIVFPFRLIRSRSVSAVQRAIGVANKHRKGLVCIELESREIQPVGRYHSNADERFKQLLKFWIGFDEIVIELDALGARDTAQYYQYRLILLA